LGKIEKREEEAREQANARGGIANDKPLLPEPSQNRTYQSFILEACSLATSSLNCQCGEKGEEDVRII